MPHSIAFLRGINLGKRRIKMDHLASLFEDLGFTNVETFIASGNVLFESAVHDDLKLALQIERHLAKSLGYEVDTFIRTREELAAVAAFHSFSKADQDNTANTVHVGFWKEAPSPATARKLSACQSAVDAFAVNGRDFYWLCRIKSHESKIWTSPQLIALALPSSTMRNITTIRKLVALNPVLVV